MLLKASVNARLSLIGMLLAWCWIPQALAQFLPTIDAVVEDRMGLLQPEKAQAITDRVNSFRVPLDAEVAILIVRDTAGDDLESYAEAVARDWRPRRGRRGTRNILVVVRLEDFQAHVAVSLDLGPAVGYSQAGNISRAITAKFRQGDFAGGLLGAVDTIRQLIEEVEPWRVPKKPAAPEPEPVVDLSPEGQAAAAKRAAAAERIAAELKSGKLAPTGSPQLERDQEAIRTRFKTLLACLGVLVVAVIISVLLRRKLNRYLAALLSAVLAGAVVLSFASVYSAVALVVTAFLFGIVRRAKSPVYDHR